MRIAMLTNNYRPFVGGVPISVERQAEELVKLGHEVTVFVPMYGKDEAEQAEVKAADDQAPERVIRYRTQKRKMDNGMVYPALYPYEITEAFRRESFDCIHVHHPMFVGPVALALGKKYDIPVIYTYHTRYEDYLHYIPCFRTDEGSSALKKKLVNKIGETIIPSYMKWFGNRCDLVLAPSAGMQQVIREYGVKGPSAIFPTGLAEDFYRGDAARSSQIRQQYGKGKKHLLVTVSRLEKEKNYRFLFRGIAELRHQFGDDFQLMVIGDGSRKAQLKNGAAILGIQDLITFVGNVPNEEVKYYLGAADLFLFASKSETQGIVLAEAMAAGNPVVAVHAVGSDDIVKDGYNGYLTEENEAAWALRAAEALKPEINRKMRQAALRTAENYRASSLAIYEEMLYNQCVRRKGETAYEGTEYGTFGQEEDRTENSAMVIH